ncbi:peptidoglycan/LPS O-acetylase OafA/YrhL [Pseudarthrobacter oxydans]|uniref:Peptidoglycan/LPS O-acetylase OafA/YrhL n=2 Tax=Pseudarthrobacter oxydans TaxID=1671 RepID=A0AAW8NBH5_PSEOX|nr:peptidoglycan/LPS O-acetylase OafA/YrhL [Pseudarthrobacter oxydans]
MQRIGSPRFTALDGLRGLAALVVLVNHCFLVSPQLAEAYREGAATPDGGWSWWLTSTPLHLIWGGSEAVYVFFVLSGFVLALPFLKATPPTWVSYYPKRLVRLYVPVWGSLLFALLLAAMVPRVVEDGASWWINLHAEPTDLLRDFLVVNGTGALNTPLWSLQWEVLFSLLLPVYMLVAIRLQKLWLLGIVGLLALTGAGSVLDLRALIYLPMFGVGVLMAVRKDRLASWADRMGAWHWVAALLLAGALLSSHWTFPSLPGSSVLAAAGAAVVIFTFLHCKPAVRLGDWKPVHWLGSRSFSLYLIHEPIVVSVALLTGTTNPFLALTIALPVSLLLTEGFFRAVEKPSHRLANAVGRRVAPKPLAEKGLAERV